MDLCNNLFLYILNNPNNTEKLKEYYILSIDTVIKENNTENKIKILENLIFIFPDDYKLYYYMGVIYKDINPNRSIMWFKLCYEKNNNFIENILDFYKILFDKDLDRYIFYLDKYNFLEKSNDNRIKQLYANLLIRDKNFKKAKDILFELIKENESAIAYLSLYNISTSDKKSLLYIKKAYLLSDKCDNTIRKQIIDNLLISKDYLYYQLENNFYNPIIYNKIENYLLNNTKKKYVFNKKKNIAKLKIGYISSDFNNHAVSNFIIPIINNHNYDKHSIYLFNTSNHINFDKYDNKCVIFNLCINNTIQIADIIYNNNIDVLIELNGLTKNNSLDVLLLNPAPIQISYIGYPNSTYLPSIKYRLVDKITDPINSIQFYTETKIYLNKCFLLFEPTIEYNLIKLHAENQNIVFGCLNKEFKNSNEFIEACNIILKKNHLCQILFKVESDESINYIKEKFQNNNRIIFVSTHLTNLEYIDLFYKIDILLDTFPYCGTTTSCYALYNSVPIITLYNKDYHVHNVTSSLLINSDLSELVAYTVDEYIEKAVQLSFDLSRINSYKNIIRDKFKNMMNKQEFMKDYENLIQEIYLNNSVK
jgi:predicted O-linked N-acetylglucosamine transferase (SPINDLY family)